MDNRQKAIELLKKMVWYREHPNLRQNLLVFLDQALAALSSEPTESGECNKCKYLLVPENMKVGLCFQCQVTEPCKTCGGRKVIRAASMGGGDEPCPDCQSTKTSVPIEPSGITGNMEIESDTIPSRIDYEVIIANQSATIKSQVEEIKDLKKVLGD